MIAEQQKQAEEARKQADKALKKQSELQTKAIKLQEKNLKFQKDQAEYVKQTEAKISELANRPAPPPPPPAAVVVTGGNAGMAEAATEAETNLESRKKGRAALRIDLNAPQMAGNTGLNVPRG